MYYHGGISSDLICW